MDHAVISEIGNRIKNDDAWLWLEEGNVFIMAVADGLGGHTDGDKAAKAACDALQKRLTKHDEKLSDIFVSINQDIFSNKKIQGYCTLAAVKYGDQRFELAHVGDTRIYVIENGSFSYISRDHSVVRALVDIGEIEYDELRHHPERNKLLRVIGESEDVKVDYYEFTSTEGILICSDGLWERVSDEKILKSFYRTKNAKAWLEKLKRLANKSSKEKDNITAIAVR